MKERLDSFITHKLNIKSRSKAQAIISQGLVLVDGKEAKPSLLVDENSHIQILEHEEYVSRGAYKLLGAIKSFNLDFKNKVVLDVGASTGGFTEVALNYGAIKVYSLDIGKDELDKSLASDKRVVNLQGRDIRSLNFEEVCDVEIIIGDLSFISLTKVLPTIKALFGNKETMFLFKPQFECGKELAKKYKGIIKDKRLHIKLLNNFVAYCQSLDFPVCNICHSPITGGDGNIEYLIYFNMTKENFDIKQLVENRF